jgi:hypothetical protein
MPQHQHCPPARRREDRNPKVSWRVADRRCMNSRRTSPKYAEKEQKFDERVAFSARPRSFLSLIC